MLLIAMAFQGIADRGRGDSRPTPQTRRQTAKLVPTAEQKAASLAALKPLILDGALAAFVNSPRYQPELKAAFEELTRIYHAENAHSMPIKPPQIR
jgi:hypothetical protein